MKKNNRFLIAMIAAFSIVLGGCSVPDQGAIESTEYLTDKTDQAQNTTDNSATASSIVVVDNLSEPLLDALDESQATESASTDASAEASTDASAAEASTESAAPEPVNIVFFGDSQIANGRSDSTDIPTLMSARIPNSVVYNLAIGGTTATVEATTSDVTPANLESTSFLGMTYCLAGKSDRNSTLSQLPNILSTMNSIDPAKVNYYVIEYGANDFFNGVTLNVSGYETPGVQAHALYNAMCMGIDVLKEISPNAKFILMTPFYGIYVADDGSYIGDSYIVSNGVGTLADYARKIVNVAEDKGVTCFDGMFMTKHDLYLDTAGEYLMDNLHLNLTGRQIFARLVAHEINYSEKNEPFAYLDQDKIKIADFNPDENYRLEEYFMCRYYPESWEKYVQGVFPLAQPSEEALNGSIAAEVAADLAKEASENSEDNSGDDNNG